MHRFRSDRRRLVVVLLLGVLVHGVGVAAQSPALRFEVASVKANTGSDLGIPFRPHPPDGVVYVNYPLESLVRFAFDVDRPQMENVPEWTKQARYDINARASGAIAENERRAMLRALLEERFALQTHVVSRDRTVLVMTTVRADRRLGAGVKPRPDCETTPCTSGGTGLPDRLQLRGTTLTRFADGMLTAMRDQLVRDETGIPGVFDIEMTFRPDSLAADAADARPSFFSAMEEQLGLKLTPQRRQVDVVVIDRIERPTTD